MFSLVNGVFLSGGLPVKELILLLVNPIHFGNPSVRPNWETQTTVSK